MNLASIREAVAARLSEVAGLRAYAVAPDQIPAGVATVVAVNPGDPYVDFQQAFAKGLGFVNFTIMVWVQAVDMRAAMIRLDSLLSSGSDASRSIVDSLMDRDRTLGGVCADLVVDSCDNVRGETVADGARYLCADLNLRVMVGRT